MVLKNLISEVKHTDLDEAKKYYSTRYHSTVFYDVDSAETLDELCEILNNADIYRCGNSFIIID